MEKACSIDGTMSRSGVTVKWSSAKCRGKFEVWSSLSKLGIPPKDALVQAGIRDLETTVARSGLCCTTNRIASRNGVDNEGEAVLSEVKQIIDDVVNVATNESGDGVKIVRADVDGDVDVSSDEEEEENELDAILDWLLFEAEYCTHALLLACGNVLLNSNGRPEKKLLWASNGHNSVAEVGLPVPTASKRLNMALESLQLLLKCPSVREHSFQWKPRFDEIIAVISSLGNDSNIDLGSLGGCGDQVTPSLNIKPFYETVTNQTGDHDLYLLQNGFAGYLDALNRLLDKTTGLHWNLTVMNALIDASCMICDYEQVHGMIDKLAAAKQITDIRVAKSYLKLFRGSFGNLSFTEKQRVMDAFYTKHGLPVWHEMDEDFGTNLALTSNKLCVPVYKKGGVAALADELCWYFMMSMKFTWTRLLQNAMKMPDMIPNLAEALRLMKPVLSVCADNGGPRLILIGLRRFLEEGNMVSSDQEAAWVRLVVSLVSEKTAYSVKVGIHTSSITCPIISKGEGIKTVIMPIMRSHPRLALVCLVALVGGIAWSTETPSPPTKPRPPLNHHTVSAAELIVVLVDVYVDCRKAQDKSDGSSLVEPCLGVVRLVTGTWKRSDLVFPMETVEWMERRWETMPWPARFSVLHYLDGLTAEPVRPVLPHCFFDVFGLDSAKFRGIDCDDWASDHNKVLCALKGFFQIALFSDDAAQQILNAGKLDLLVEKMKGNRLNSVLVDGLVDTLMECGSERDWLHCAKWIAVLMDQIKDAAGASLEQSLCSDSIAVGLHMVAPACKFCEVVCKLVKKSSALTATFIRYLSAVCRAIVTERVIPMEDPVGRVVSWRWLFEALCKVIESCGRTTTEMETLLSQVLDGLNGDTKNRNTAMLTDTMRRKIQVGMNEIAVGRCGRK